MKKITFLILVFYFFNLTAIAQSSNSETHSGVGLTASLQSEQLDFLIPIWISNKAILAPSFSFISAQDVGSDLGLGLVFKNYLGEIEDAVPYVALKGGAIFGIPNEGDTITDFLFGAGFGGEYFFQPKFSIGIEIQGNLSISDEGSFRFGNPGNVNFNTATALTASIYF